MRYKNFDIEDFVNDDKFREWVLSPHPEINYFWEKWLLQNPEKDEVINQAREIVLAVGFQPPQNRERVKKKLWEKIKESNTAIDRQKGVVGAGKVQPMYRHKVNQREYSYKKRQKVYLSIAAGITLLAVAIGLQMYNSDFNKQKSDDLVTKSNPRGQKSELRLPDGSMVYLNAESNVRYAENFQPGKREIFLEGEAFFEVKKDISSPFTVITGSLATTAVGTSFNIQAYKNEPQISVALISGKVMVDDLATKNSLTLDPGQGVVLEKETGKITSNEIDIAQTLFWKNRTIYFENTDFPEAIQYLERWFGVTITLNNYPRQLLTCSGKFENESLENVLKVLGFALNFEYEINKEKVNIMFKSN